MNTLTDKNVTVNVNSTSDPKPGILVQLVETGVNTNTFQKTFTFSTISSDDPNDIIKALHGNTVRAIYNDTHTVTGSPARPKASATWIATVTGIPMALTLILPVIRLKSGKIKPVMIGTA